MAKRGSSTAIFNFNRKLAFNSIFFWKLKYSSSKMLFTSHRFKSTFILFASIKETSMISLISISSLLPLLSISAPYFLRSDASSSGSSASIFEKPRIAFKGFLISCDILAKNWVFKYALFSAFSLARINSFSKPLRSIISWKVAKMYIIPLKSNRDKVISRSIGSPFFRKCCHSNTGFSLLAAFTKYCKPMLFDNCPLGWCLGENVQIDFPFISSSDETPNKSQAALLL